MTEARSLADRIDPRKQIAGQSHHGLWLASDLDLIAASDALRSLALPADLAGLVDRIDEACNGHPHAKIPWPHRVLHESRDAITALSARVAELEAARDAAIRKHSVAAAHNVIARRLALEDAAKVCDRWADQNEPFAETNSTKQGKVSASRYCATAIRALSPTLDMDALTARAIEAAQSAYSGAPDSHSQNAANVARAVLSALLEGGE